MIVDYSKKPFKATRVTPVTDRDLSILMLHNCYQYDGGEDISTSQEVKMLRDRGQNVELIEWSNKDIEAFSPAKKARLFFSASWDYESANWLRSKLSSQSTNILHVQNFFPLFSPSIHQAAKKADVATVQHLHNFRLGCLNSYLFRNGQVCEDCVGKSPWRGVMRQCYRNSLPASMSVWQMITSNRMNRTWDRYIDAFITPSQFAANKLGEIGLPSDRIHIKPNFIADPLQNQTIPPLPETPTFLYTGRLSPEKGLHRLLEVWLKLKQPEWKLIVIGDGQQRVELEEFCQEKHLRNVVFLGRQSSAQVLQAVQRATAVLVPSQLYETFGLVVIEAFACGRIALVSDLGALTELVEEGSTGFRIPAANVDAWIEKIRWCAHSPTELTKMGNRARLTYLEKFTPEANYHQLLQIYSRVLR